MAQQRKILFMDDDEIYIDSLSGHLQAEKYEVLKALTIAEAKRILAATWVHLMIVDLNMVGADNDDDRSGLEMVNNPQYAIIPKVILTGYADDPKVLRQMIKPSLDGNPLVIDFLGKGDGDIPNKIIALFNALPFNWDLQILWAAGPLCSLLGLAGLLIADEERSQTVQHIDELEDLFRKIFSDKREITIERLYAYHAGIAWLEITIHRNSASAEQFMVACGQKAYIKQQIRHYDLIPQSNMMRRIKTFETLCFAATVYECLGSNLAKLASFQHLFFRWPSQAVEEMVNNLFGSTLATWHKQRSSMREIGQLRQLCEAWPQRQKQNLGKEEWNVKIRELCQNLSVVGSLFRVDYSPEWLTLYTSDKVNRYPNPAHFLLTKNTLLNTQIAFGIVHGHLQPDNILIDFQKHIRLIEFSQVHEGPILLDFIALEVALKQELLNMAGIEAWCAIEEQLLAVKSLTDPLCMDDFSPETQKILRVIGVVRERAASAINQGVRGYLAALFVDSMTQLATYDKDKMLTGDELSTYFYYLLSAAMICNYLPSPREFVLNSADRYVMIEGERKPRLSSGEWRLLEFMHRRVGQLCEYKDFLKEVYQDAQSLIEDGAWMASSGKPKVNAAIGRLRDKLEPDPDNPTYIVTEREYGYKLEV